MAGIFNAEIFNNDVFNVGAVTPAGGKGDNPAARRRHTIKPTGFTGRAKKQSKVDERVDESREIHAEVAARIAREFGEETIRLRGEQAEQPAIEAMSLREIDAEIGALLRKKLRTEEDELMLLLLMAAAA